MNRNKTIILSFSLLLSSPAHANPIAYTCKAAKRFIISATIGAYVYHNIETHQDLTQLPEPSRKDISDFINKLGMTYQNSCASFDKTYTALKKIASDVKPSTNFGQTTSFVDTDIHDDFAQFQNQRDTERSISLELEMDCPQAAYKKTPHAYLESAVKEKLSSLDEQTPSAKE